MFDGGGRTIDHTLEQRRAERARELRRLAAEEAGIKQRVMEIVRTADDERDWQAAGCSSSAQWLARVTRSDYSSAKRLATTSEALRTLPMLDSALSTGALSLDQVSAAAEFATPETDATLAAESAGRTPSQVAVAARTLNPPQRADDQALYARRSLAMTWTHGGRELAISGRLPLEQGSAFEHAIWEAAKAQRAREKRDDVARDWSHSAADALVALTTQSRVGGTRGETTTAPRPARSRATLIVHVAADGPPLLEGAGPISPETAEYLSCDARRIEITPRGRDLVHSRATRCASFAQHRALHKRSLHCQYPACTATRELEAHHLVAYEHGGRTELANLILLCPRHHRHLHDHHICADGSAEAPRFTAESGHAILANPANAPPATRLIA